MIVLWLPFFPFLNLVGVFIVIGIGADDVFVFMDAWKQSEVMMTGNNAQFPHLRMAWVLKRAGGAMLVTSLTTSFAFFASAVSNITSLKCFGIYTGLVVLADFVLMITYLPCVVMINHLYVQAKMGRKN
jgi:predicted RND superfamily exporter protein